MDEQGKFKQANWPASFSQQSHGEQPAHYVQAPLPQIPLQQSPQWQAQTAFPTQIVSQLTLPRSIIRQIFKLMLYLTGIFIAIIGTFSVALDTSNKNNSVENISVAFGIVAAAVSIFIFLQKKHRIHCLSWPQYLKWIGGATLVASMAFILVFIVSNPNTNRVASTIASSFLLFYGIILILITYIKPPLPQRVNESVYSILKAVPGNQLVISELFARLQKEYKQLPEATFCQYIMRLEYIEQMQILGTSVIVCRMKEMKKAVSLPQKASVFPMSSSAQAPSVSPSYQATTPNPSAVQSVPLPSLRPQEPFPPSDTQGKTVNPQTSKVLPRQAQNDVNHTAKPEEETRSFSPKSPPCALPPVPPKSNVAKLPPSASEEQATVKIFCCYAHEDEQLLMKLKAHLKPQQRQGLIHIWYDRDISAGTEWEHEIDKQLNSAHIILLLVSSDFMASDYCYTKEMQEALDRHKRGDAHTIPIILRPTDWQETPIGKLQALPRDGEPITLWANLDQAFLDVTKGIRSVVETFLTKPQQGNAQTHTSSNSQQMAAGVEVIRVRCKQGKLIVTNRRIVIELSAFGQVLESKTLLRTSLTSIDSKLAVPPVFGRGGGVNLTFHGKGKEVLQADLVPPKEAQEIIAAVS